jgi:NAD(P)-dependent dehydrogenase (short-subunit alcohol dehydrogenase family)
MANKDLLTGNIALVTGAGRGIGRSVALRLASCGADVILSARTDKEIKEVAAEIEGGGRRALAVKTDVSAEREVEDLFARIQEEFGQLDILVNNAGIGLFGPLEDFPVEEFDRVIAVNLKGTFMCCQQAMQMMKPAGRGYIINVSSVVGFKGYPGQSAYTASKHGIMGLTKSLANEAQEEGIRVSAILPGGVDTGLVKNARPDLDSACLLSPDDVAQAVEYLLSLSDRAAVDQIYIRRRNSQPF